MASMKASMIVVAAVLSVLALQCEANNNTTDIVLNPAESARTYSSVWDNNAPGVGHARSMLNSPQAWTALPQSVGEWMQIDLGGLYIVKGVVTQGRHLEAQWVTTYTVKTSLDGSSWGAEVGPLNGATSSDGQVPAYLPASTNARYVRLYPKTWNSYISMRAAVIVLEAADTTTTTPNTTTLATTLTTTAVLTTTPNTTLVPTTTTILTTTILTNTILTTTILATTLDANATTTVTQAATTLASTTVAGNPMTTVTGTMVMTVANASSVVNNVNFKNAVAAGIANVANVSASAVAVVLTASRRLSTEARFLTAAGSTITVAFTITVPVTTAASATTLISAASTTALATAVTTQLAASGDSSVSGITVTVTSATATYTNPIAQGSAGASKMVSFSGVRAVATVAALSAAVVVLWGK